MTQRFGVTRKRFTNALCASRLWSFLLANLNGRAEIMNVEGTRLAINWTISQEFWNVHLQEDARRAERNLHISSVMNQIGLDHASSPSAQRMRM